MKKFLTVLVIVVGVTAIVYFRPTPLPARTTQVLQHVAALIKLNSFIPKIKMPPPNEIIDLLNNSKPNLRQQVIDKVLTTIRCSAKTNILFNPILGIIDYSLPSNAKRLWVFDLANKKLLFNTYVTHGLRSGELITQYFSNKNNSKASSIGVFRTDQAYIGRHGLSLKLDGLDQCFNDNAASRSIVMHGSWYAEEYFIQRYKRAGRSWGCPAVPSSEYAQIINALKDKALLVVYYPNDDWFLNSKFLSCDIQHRKESCKTIEEKTHPPLNYQEDHEPVVFVDKNLKKGKLEETSPILAMPVNTYVQTFHKNAPLNRMIRRKINQTEYIALSTAEINAIYVNQSTNNKVWSELAFMLPTLKTNHGYFATEMQPLNFGQIREITPSKNRTNKVEHFTVTFTNSKRELELISTTKFIRWLG